MHNEQYVEYTAMALSASVTEAATALGIDPPTEEQVAGMKGAQVVLDPESAAALGARGVFADMHKNTLLRDKGLELMGLNPADPNGDNLDPPPAPPPEE